MATNQVTVPVGPNTATVQVLDQNGSDITGSCTISAVSSDPTTIQIGSPDASTPNVIPFVAANPGTQGTTITYTATNSQGSVVQTDTVDVMITAPAAMTVVYGTTIPNVINPLGGKGKK